MARSDAKRVLADSWAWIVLPPLLVAVLGIAILELVASRRTQESRGGGVVYHALR
ncbi:MAG: hypothetical protein IT453_08940 [Planctomycetes bacterium]|nr:hypothetical protein [Planctomycetota bacterium]